MALGKIARAVVPSDAKALAILGAIFGALAIFPLLKLFEGIGSLEPQRTDGSSSALTAALATAVVVASPVYWFNELRPLRDILALCVTPCA